MSRVMCLIQCIVMLVVIIMLISKREVLYVLYTDSLEGGWATFQAHPQFVYSPMLSPSLRVKPVLDVWTLPPV